MPNAIIITSLPPALRRIVSGRDFGAVYQRACIDSWVRAGFDVVSLNTAEEIEKLEPLDYPVTYVPSLHARPTITEILALIQGRNDPLIGIINADCYLLGYEPFVAGLKKASERGMVMIERVNIDPVSLLPSGQTCLGFDAFFLDPKFANGIRVHPDLAVGQPWWDYWFPAAFAVEGVELLRPQSPLVFHLDHPQNWSQDKWLKYGRIFLEEFSKLEERKCPSFLSGVRGFARPELASREDLGGFGDWCFNWLRDQSFYLDKSEDPTAAELFGKILTAVTNFDGMHANTLALAQARREISRLSELQRGEQASVDVASNRPLWFRVLRALLKG